uniref:Serine protease n=1 Tax=Chromera velia CCMP2878 TaxID=1169474 RepID=A0A0G4GG33_9ALVE|eukprot:Cvel_21746.t1-p1 / transcript=Cvel_21746.t1 / gene=Cvel_21746 / organism=Chromera_velia_CCMP2878 / gene_product=hypothetical protein / transcript_product=hypothetical protein / location=Cvel_scaffold2066:11026-15740(+) / protein_length=694 / sequence_SO=supercontig / SO=protein_coding / is_pseudo=false
MRFIAPLFSLLSLAASQDFLDAADTGAPTFDMIWDADDRHNPANVTAPLAATVMLVRKLSTAIRGDMLVLRPNTLLQGRPNLCGDVQFQDEPAPGSCSGVLVAQDMIATAAHCANDMRRAAAYFFVFGFSTAEQEAQGREALNEVPLRDVYEAKEVFGWELGNSHSQDFRRSDWALIRFTRPVEGREPVKVREEGPATSAEHFYVIGHPNGLPAKSTRRREGLDEVSMVLWNNNNAYFKARLDTFGGNSGSPVFNAETDELEGLLVRGDSDWMWEYGSGQRCMREARCPQDRGQRGIDRGVLRCAGEDVTRSTELAGHMAFDRAQKAESGEKIPVDVRAPNSFPISVPDWSHIQPRAVSLFFSSPTPPTPGSYLHSVGVNLEATHEYSLTELSLSLQGPGSNAIELGPVPRSPLTHFGASRPDVHTTFANLPRGLWQLRVRDTAGQDVGQIVNASLTFFFIEGDANPAVSMEMELKTELPVPIPDYDPAGVELKFSPPAEEAEKLKDADGNDLAVFSWDLDVTIDHDRADEDVARVYLSSPDSRRVYSFGAFNQGEMMEFGESARQQLFFYGADANGDWTVRVVDSKENITGTITKATLKVKAVAMPWRNAVEEEAAGEEAAAEGEAGAEEETVEGGEAPAAGDAEGAGEAEGSQEEAGEVPEEGSPASTSAESPESPPSTPESEAGEANEGQN